MINWQIKTFDELSNDELFEVLRLRQAVFVVEQECAYPDIDATDKVALHLLGYLAGEPHAELAVYARLIKPGVTYEYASIGRVVVAPQARGKDYGRALMLRAITEVEQRYPHGPIKIGAQQHLETFYVSLGFERVSEMYLEDDIPHIDMMRGSPPFSQH